MLEGHVTHLHRPFQEEKLLVQKKQEASLDLPSVLFVAETNNFNLNNDIPVAEKALAVENWIIIMISYCS